MDNNKNGEYDLGEYKKDLEEIQDYCLSLKLLEENIEFIYNNLNSKNIEKDSRQAYLIDINDYNKFKEQIEYNTFINEIQNHKEKVVIKLVTQNSEKKDE